MTLQRDEVPVAYSMLELADQLLCIHANKPLYLFFCYWVAFNNIYVTVADRRGPGASLKTDVNGAVRTRQCGHVRIPEVAAISERRQIDLAVAELPDRVKHQLITHPSVRFFADRTPRWHGRPIQYDARGQRLNGVLNVGYTLNDKNPVWSPLDTASYEQYVRGDTVAGSRETLAKQIVNMLYAVRNNTFHGGKRADDADDGEVVEKALPLLKMIVESFMVDGRSA